MSKRARNFLRIIILFRLDCGSNSTAGRAKRDLGAGLHVLTLLVGRPTFGVLRNGKVVVESEFTIDAHLTAVKRRPSRGSGIAPSWQYSGTAIGETSALLLYCCTRREVWKMSSIEKNSMQWRVDPDFRVVNTLTRKQPDGWRGYKGRIDKALLAKTRFPPGQNPKIFVCGPSSLVEDASKLLLELGT